MSNRPLTLSAAGIEHVARQLLPRALSWLGGDEQPDEVLADLVGALTDEYDWDGYTLAEALDRACGWSPDSQLVDLLDRASHWQWEQLRAEVAAWVRENGVKVRQEIGDRVSYLSNGRRVTGTVIGLDRVHALVTVCVPELGHKGHGCMVGTVGEIVRTEECEP